MEGGRSDFVNGFARIRSVDSHGDIGMAGCVGHGGVYISALHWSMMTITSIGYGDISPTNISEYNVCIVLMLIAGVTWAYIIGEICRVATNGNPVTRRANEAEDAINHLMASESLPDEFRQKVRTYLVHSTHAMHDTRRKGIVKSLSPTLAG